MINNVYELKPKGISNYDLNITPIKVIDVKRVDGQIHPSVLIGMVGSLCTLVSGKPAIMRFEEFHQPYKTGVVTNIKSRCDKIVEFTTDNLIFTLQEQDEDKL